MFQQLRGLTKHWLRLSEDLLLPPQCAACQTALDESPSDRISLCPRCRSELEPPVVNACRQCAAPVPFPPDPAATPGCPRCAGQRWHFETAFALGRYDGPLRKAVLRMKLSAEEPLSLVMGRLLVNRIAVPVKAWQPDIIAPIPMHWLRRWQRSVNNPEFLAAELSRTLRIPWQRRLLKRCRHTIKHGQLSHDQWRDVIRGAFAVSRFAKVSGRRVLLVDDILTTGSTCNEAAKMLRQAGAEAVAVAVIARAEGQ